MADEKSDLARRPGRAFEAMNEAALLKDLHRKSTQGCWMIIQDGEDLPEGATAPVCQIGLGSLKIYTDADEVGRMLDDAHFIRRAHDVFPEVLGHIEYLVHELGRVYELNRRLLKVADSLVNSEIEGAHDAIEYAGEKLSLRRDGWCPQCGDVSAHGSLYHLDGQWACPKCGHEENDDATHAA